ncbi:hypothetical protein [Jannaschia sp. R86511]|uniref:hypothetical protein n=1 Tax=Jannaschia sp. R86511 TaxID=3093853 RepID=UPI0036D28556
MVPSTEPLDVDDTTAPGAAVGFVRAITRTDLPYEQWWAGLAGFLSPDATTIYDNVDPANVPTDPPTGPGELDPASTQFLATVTVPTDAGPWTVTLLRLDTDRWLVDRATPPSP